MLWLRYVSGLSPPSFELPWRRCQAGCSSQWSRQAPANWPTGGSFQATSSPCPVVRMTRIVCDETLRIVTIQRASPVVGDSCLAQAALAARPREAPGMAERVRTEERHATAWRMIGGGTVWFGTARKHRQGSRWCLRRAGSSMPRTYRIDTILTIRLGRPYRLAPAVIASALQSSRLPSPQLIAILPPPSRSRYILICGSCLPGHCCLFHPVLAADCPWAPIAAPCCRARSHLTAPVRRVTRVRHRRRPRYALHFIPFASSPSCITDPLFASAATDPCFRPFCSPWLSELCCFSPCEDALFPIDWVRSPELRRSS